MRSECLSVCAFCVEHLHILFIYFAKAHSQQLPGIYSPHFLSLALALLSFCYCHFGFDNFQRFLFVLFPPSLRAYLHFSFLCHHLPTRQCLHLTMLFFCTFFHLKIFCFIFFNFRALHVFRRLQVTSQFFSQLLLLVSRCFAF